MLIVCIHVLGVLKSSSKVESFWVKEDANTNITSYLAISGVKGSGEIRLHFVGTVQLSGCCMYTCTGGRDKASFCRDNATVRLHGPKFVASDWLKESVNFKS